MHVDVEELQAQACAVEIVLLRVCDSYSAGAAGGRPEELFSCSCNPTWMEFSWGSLLHQNWSGRRNFQSPMSHFVLALYFAGVAVYEFRHIYQRKHSRT